MKTSQRGQTETNLRQSQVISYISVLLHLNRHMTVTGRERDRLENRDLEDKA